MTIDEGTLSLGMSVASWIAFLAFVVKASMRFGALELKVDTMWGFQMRRSMSELVTTHMGDVNSPLKISKEAFESLDPIKHALIEWYQHEDREVMGDANLMLEIERRFGDQILKMVCLPNGLSYGACLIIALAVAKGARPETPVDIDVRVMKDAH